MNDEGTFRIYKQCLFRRERLLTALEESKRAKVDPWKCERSSIESPIIRFGILFMMWAKAELDPVMY